MRRTPGWKRCSRRKRLTVASAAVLATLLFETGTVSGQGLGGQLVLPPTSPLLRQVEEGPDIVVTYDGSRTIKAQTLNRVSEHVGLRPNQLVDVSVQYGIAKSGSLTAVVPLDGGIIPGSDKKFVVGSDGSLRFRFKAGGSPGVYRVGLRGGAPTTVVRFWVFDEKDPRRNPPVLVPN